MLAAGGSCSVQRLGLLSQDVQHFDGTTVQPHRQDVGLLWVEVKAHHTCTASMAQAIILMSARLSSYATPIPMHMIDL